MEEEKMKYYLLKVSDKSLKIDQYEIGTTIEVLQKMGYKEFSLSFIDSPAPSE